MPLGMFVDRNTSVPLIHTALPSSTRTLRVSVSGMELAAVNRLVLGDAASATGVLRLDHARVAGLALTGVVVPIRYADGILTAAPFEAGFYGGRLTGHVAVHTRAPVAFEGVLTASGVSLDALPKLPPSVSIARRLIDATAARLRAS